MPKYKKENSKHTILIKNNNNILIRAFRKRNC